MWHTAERRFIRHVCFQESITAICLGNSKHPLPARSFRFLRAAVRSTCFAVVASCPSLRCSCMKNLSHRDKQRVWSKSYGFKICYNPVIVLSVVLWDCCKPTNTCRDWAFSNSGLEVGLPAFQLFVGHVCFFRNPFPPFILGIPSIHSLPEASGSSLHYGCIMPIPQLQLQKRMSGVGPKMWALLGSQSAKSDSVSIKWFILAPHVTSRLSQIVWY